MAQLLDNMILGAPFPTKIDGVAVQHAHRAAAPPVPLPVDPDDLRHCLTCSYLIVMGA
jgi:hypothetical protein